MIILIALIHSMILKIDFSLLYIHSCPFLITLQVSYETKGQILVEVEPIRYQLDHIQYRTIRAKTEKQVVVLSRRVLSNEIEEGPNDEWDTVTSMAAFNATYRFYWGQIAGLIKALPASATTLSNPQQNKLTEQDETKVGFISNFEFYLYLSFSAIF